MIGLIWSLIGAVLLGFYNALLLLDDRTPENDIKNKKIEDDWHKVGASIFLYLSGTAWYVWGWQYILFTLAAFWCIYAGIVHKIGLNKNFFFVGTTAKTDKTIRKFFPKNPTKGSAIAKIGLLIIGLALIIFV